MDPDRLLYVTETDTTARPVFADSYINEQIEDYDIYAFRPAYPAARLISLQRIWFVECNNLNLMYLLESLDSSLFVGGEEVPESVLTYSPNDYGYATGGQKDLDLINAKGAWDISKGNSNVVIGIVDTYFDLNHGDLAAKIDTVRANVFGANAEHGTAVAGAAAAHTDNGVGISSIGFYCKLDLSSNWGGTDGLQELLKMSKDRRRIVNASWGGGCAPVINHQQISVEIYENGTVACFGAGNGFIIRRDSATGPRKLKQHYCHGGAFYPAAYPHNISVSSVGSDVDYGQKSWWSGLTDSVYWNQKDVHENIVGRYDTIDVASVGYPAGSVFPVEVHNHHAGVDIVAPGYKVRTTTLGSSYFSSAWGTSFASPLVAGTCGLMLSAKPCLSPYQVEYLLKTTAVNIYNIPENQPYVGMLGAGRLNAAAAVSAAANYDCNSIYTATMYIQGIELNTVCRPGQSSNGTKPTFSPIIVNGTPPYTYEWKALPGNQTQLDTSYIATPQINASWGYHRAQYYLTVYDNSPIQKVASKQIIVHLKDSASLGYDLAVRDGYMDMCNEPNDRRVRNGRQGSPGITEDAGSKSVVFSPDQTLLLQDIDFEAEERLPIILEFKGNGYVSETPFLCT